MRVSQEPASKRLGGGHGLIQQIAKLALDSVATCLATYPSCIGLGKWLARLAGFDFECGFHCVTPFKSGGKIAGGN